MDISFKTPLGRFNYRVCAVILRAGHLLTVCDNQYSYAYLPGGRVKMGEDSLQALNRELFEELQANLTILRPLWLCEDFFTEEDSGERFHEICLYYLVDAGELPHAPFTRSEGERKYSFEWSALESLKDMRVYPEFIREKILQLPDQLEMLIKEHN